MKKKSAVILNAEQLSLVFNVSEFTIKKLARDGDIPCTFVNRRPQFNLAVLMKHFEKIEGCGGAA